MTYQYEQFDTALRLLNGRLEIAGASTFNLVVCGGTALAAVDQFGSYHVTDLQELDPTDDELLGAVAWSRTHDPSDGYLEGVKMFFREFGYEHLVERI